MFLSILVFNFLITDYLIKYFSKNSWLILSIHHSMNCMVLHRSAIVSCSTTMEQVHVYSCSVSLHPFAPWSYAQLNSECIINFSFPLGFINYSLPLLVIPLTDTNQFFWCVSSGLACIQKGSHVRLKRDHGRKLLINPALLGNNVRWLTRSSDQCFFQCVCTQLVSLLHVLHVCRLRVQRKYKKSFHFIGMHVISFPFLCPRAFHFTSPCLSGAPAWRALFISSELSITLSIVLSFCSSCSRPLFLSLSSLFSSSLWCCSLSFFFHSRSCLTLHLLSA